MEISLKRKNKLFHYESITSSNILVNIDGAPEIGGKNNGARPMELILMGLGGCASIDLGLILKKQKQEIIDYKVDISATRKEDISKAFKAIQLHFVLWGKLDKNKVERAIELTLTKYCSVALSLNENINITSTYEIR